MILKMLQVATIHMRSREMMCLALVRQNILMYTMYFIDPELKATPMNPFINQQGKANADSKTAPLTQKGKLLHSLRRILWIWLSYI